MKLSASTTPRRGSKSSRSSCTPMRISCWYGACHADLVRDSCCLTEPWSPLEAKPQTTSTSFRGATLARSSLANPRSVVPHNAVRLPVPGLLTASLIREVNGVWVQRPMVAAMADATMRAGPITTTFKVGRHSPAAKALCAGNAMRSIQTSVAGRLVGGDRVVWQMVASEHCGRWPSCRRRPCLCPAKLACFEQCPFMRLVSTPSLVGSAATIYDFLTGSAL